MRRGPIFVAAVGLACLPAVTGLERGNGKLLEVYRPVWTASGRPLLFETYFRYGTVTQRAGQLWRGFAGITLSSLLLLMVFLIPIFLTLMRRLQTRTGAAGHAVASGARCVGHRAPSHCRDFA